VGAVRRDGDGVHAPLGEASDRHLSSRTDRPRPRFFAFLDAGRSAQVVVAPHERANLRVGVEPDVQSPPFPPRHLAPPVAGAHDRVPPAIVGIGNGVPVVAGKRVHGRARVGSPIGQPHEGGARLGGKLIQVAADRRRDIDGPEQVTGDDVIAELALPMDGTDYAVDIHDDGQRGIGGRDHEPSFASGSMVLTAGAVPFQASSNSARPMVDPAMSSWRAGSGRRHSSRSDSRRKS